MTSRGIVVAALLAVALASCRKDRRPEVEQAVRTYLDKLVVAYRVSDASLMDPLVNEQQGLRLTGLIGVKRDAGVALDAKLLELTFTKVQPRGAFWIAETRERWYYQDRRIGRAGERVGEDSTDSYALRYVFSRKGGRWILQDLEFTEPPIVGRKSFPIPIEARQMHGLPPASAGGAAPAGEKAAGKAGSARP